MRALLLAAGLGTRLRPLTNTLPKCLVPINGKPLLEIWLERLTNDGFGPFILNTHYMAEKVESFIMEGKFRDCVTIVSEATLEGTAGTLISNLDFFLDQDAILIHADNYCLADMRLFKTAHFLRPAGCLMTMMTFRTESPSSCGIVEVDDTGVLVGFHEKVSFPPGNLANGAVYIISKEFIEWIRINPELYIDFSKDVIPRLVGRIFCHETDEIFIDIGTPESYILANELSSIL